MAIRQAVVVLGFGAAALMLSEWRVVAQQPYHPRSPTFSPWLNLNQRNTGALDNYHTYVRPEFERRENLRQQANWNQSQVQVNKRLADNVARLQREENAVRPTGTASVFGHYSHYYPRYASGQGGAKSRPARVR